MEAKKEEETHQNRKEETHHNNDPSLSVGYFKELEDCLMMTALCIYQLTTLE